MQRDCAITCQLTPTLPNNQTPSTQTHYVERLDRLYLHNASMALWQLYKLISGFIDPHTREKIVFLPHDAAEATAVLTREMDLEVCVCARCA